MTNYRIVVETRANGKQIYSVQYEEKTFWGLRSVWYSVSLIQRNSSYEVIRYFESVDEAKEYIDKARAEEQAKEGYRIVNTTHIPYE